MHEYSQAELTRLFRVPASLVRALAQARHITPSAPKGKTSYTYQDLWVLRAAGALKAVKISTPKITAALASIRAAVPPGSMLTALSLAASGKDFALREGAQVWEANSRQYALALETAQVTAVTPLTRPPADPPAYVQAEAHFARGYDLEESDVHAARGAYLDALHVHGEHLDARINLGRLLHLAGELTEAERVYRGSKHSSAVLLFNLAILLEDLGKEDEAISAYREALALDPLLHDAHFNLSRLYERTAEPQAALRHLLAYRRHIGRLGDS